MQMTPANNPSVGRDISRFVGLMDPKGAMFFIFKPAA
jgi:hypothetical protein